MVAPRHARSRFAVCIRSDDADLLTPRMVYEILADESAARSKFVRVVDNEGEDYLYPADCFVFVKASAALEQALLGQPGVLPPLTPRRRSSQAERAAPAPAAC